MDRNSQGLDDLRRTLDLCPSDANSPFFSANLCPALWDKEVLPDVSQAEDLVEEFASVPALRL